RSWRRARSRVLASGSAVSSSRSTRLTKYVSPIVSPRARSSSHSPDRASDGAALRAPGGRGCGYRPRVARDGHPRADSSWSVHRRRRPPRRSRPPHPRLCGRPSGSVRRDARASPGHARRDRPRPHAAAASIARARSRPRPIAPARPGDISSFARWTPASAEPCPAIAPARPAALRRGRRVGFWSLSAGAGSSTVAALLAHRSAAGGEAPLLVDLDRWVPSLALRAGLSAANVADALLQPGREAELVSGCSAI